MRPVVCVGDLMVDVVTVMGGPLAVGSDTPARVETHGGGSAANVAAWLATLGVPTTFAGRVGDDPLGRGAVADLEVCGVRVAVAADSERPTGTCVVLVSPGGERSMLPDPGANAALRPDDLPVAAFVPGGHLHLSGYSLFNPGSRDAALAALDLSSRRGMTVSVDPSSAAPLAALGAGEFFGWLGGGSLCLANADEARVLTGVADPVKAAEALAGFFHEAVVKLGGDGALWCGGAPSPVRVPAVAAPVVDTTGAGDAFAAGFLARWLDGEGPEAALRAGCAVAAQVVSRPGARPRRPR